MALKNQNENGLGHSEAANASVSTNRSGTRPKATKKGSRLRPEVLVTRPWSEVGQTVMNALVSHPDLYIHCGTLTLVRDHKDLFQKLDSPGPLMVMLGKTLVCKKRSGDAMVAAEAPASWAQGVLLDFPSDPRFRVIDDVSDGPVLVLKDDQPFVLAEPGYHVLDDGRGMFIKRHGLDVTHGAMPELSRENAQSARQKLLEHLQEFPWQSNTDQAAWLALVLTMVGKHLYSGAHPAWVFEAQHRGAGKSLAAQLAFVVATGSKQHSHSQDSEEEAKKLLFTCARNGTTIMFFDNCKTRIGGATLEAQITSCGLAGRILGASEGQVIYWRPVYVFTANGASVTPDMAERAVPVRLGGEPGRRGLDFPDVEAIVTAAAAELFGSACTILAATHQALLRGERIDTLPWGSFVGWSAVVPKACVFSGLPDLKVSQGDLLQEHRQCIADLVVALWKWRSALHADVRARPWIAKDLREALHWQPSLLRDVLELLEQDSLLESSRQEPPTTQKLNTLLKSLVGHTHRQPIDHEGRRLAIDNKDATGQPKYVVRDLDG